jgi:polyisoprenoid-binding protein YceI
MPRFDAESAECTVLTYKEGLLSPVAHDLKIAVTRFSVTVTREADAPFAIRVEVDPASLRVLSAMRDGREAPQLLSESDRRKIERNIVSEVLAASAHPQITFVGTAVPISADRLEVSGQLTLHGRTRELRCTARTTSDRHVAEVRLHQPDYGIKPYTALLGTLRVQADVTVRLSVPRLEAASAEAPASGPQ